MTRDASSDTRLTYDWWSLARYLLTSLRCFVGGTLSFAAAVLAAVTLEALAALRFFVGVGGCVVGGCGVGGCVVGACEVGGGLILAARATLAGAITFSLVVLAAVILVLASVSKAVSGVDGEAERTIHLPEKNSRQFGEMMVFALSQRNNSLALSRNGRRTRSTPRPG